MDLKIRKFKKEKKINLSRLVLILIFFFSTILIFGCSESSDVKDNLNKLKGTEGLDVEFIKDTPSSNILEDSEIVLGLKFENKGTYDLNEAFLSFLLEEDYLTLNEEEFYSIPLLKGKTIMNPYGEYKTEFFNLNSKKIEEVTKAHNSRVILQTCYQYQTKASTKVCLNPDIFNKNPSEQACESIDVSLTTQGAPVAVKKIEVKMIPVDETSIKPTFTIHVSNVGNGEILRKGSWKGFCKGEISEENTFDKISFIASLDGKQITCDSAEFKLEETDNYFTCWTEPIKTSEIAFETLLDITINYDYSAIYYKDFTIHSKSK